MKTFLFLIATILSLATTAQVSKVTIQASGLTCSMCSNSINKSLKTIDFIQNVNPNIQTSSFEITFKPGADKTFYILNTKDQSLNGAKQVRIVDKGFLSAKDFKKITLATPATGNGVYNVTI
jgi:copper chaperone CopZ